jgi:hypothetical protein
MRTASPHGVDSAGRVMENGAMNRHPSQWLILALLSLSALAQSNVPCKVTFSVVVKDDLNNMHQGFGPKTLDWYQKKMVKKYPGVCYSQSASPVVLFFSSSPAVYHGVKQYSTTETHNDPVQGTVTDTGGQQVGDVNGTVQTTTTTEHSVPYEVNYDVLYLSLEQQQPDGSWKLMHNFSGKTLHPTYYGICTHNCHPNYKLVEGAVKWLHDGGLTDPMQSVAP